MYHNGINNVFFIWLTVKFQTSAGEALEIGQKVAIILLHKDWLISIIIFVKLPPYALGPDAENNEENRTKSCWYNPVTMPSLWASLCYTQRQGRSQTTHTKKDNILISLDNDY